MSPVHDQVKMLVDQLTESQAQVIGQVMAMLVAAQEKPAASGYLYVPGMSFDDYDPAKDPIVTGELSFSGVPSSVSSAEQSEAMLYEDEYNPKKRLPADYDPDKDPSVGFFSGPADLGRRTKDILRAEFGLRKPQDQDEDAKTE